MYNVCLSLSLSLLASFTFPASPSLLSRSHSQVGYEAAEALTSTHLRQKHYYWLIWKLFSWSPAVSKKNGENLSSIQVDIIKCPKWTSTNLLEWEDIYLCSLRNHSQQNSFPTWLVLYHVVEEKMKEMLLFPLLHHNEYFLPLSVRSLSTKYLCGLGSWPDKRRHLVVQTITHLIKIKSADGTML